MLRAYGDSNAVVIHPPFDNLPDSVVLKGGMTYLDMQQHLTWFLDAKDYIRRDGNLDCAIRYPDALKPPRSARVAELLLRCTFCSRSFRGKNAKAMWTRHVTTVHRVQLQAGQF
ncbi:hypothetical protein B0H13DRAFT_1669763 [Mycena leptocephala]|nr:hypothetical protein B0H13DRAFT_1669763 [Mycena leptocephala]